MIFIIALNNQIVIFITDRDSRQNGYVLNLHDFYLFNVLSKYLNLKMT